jgi:hypothetical protein
MTGIPFMITEAQKQQLRGRGFYEAQIRNFTPVQAHEILFATPDRHEAERFLAALDPDTTQFTFQTFDDNKERREQKKQAGKKDAFAKVLHGTLAQLWDTLVRLNQKGAGVYVTANVTDGKGRTKKNMVGIRTHFADLDGAPLEPVMNNGSLPPHIVTETSPGRFHTYWRVITTKVVTDTEDDAKQFSATQKTIAERYGGDASVNDLPRVVRLPGFVHRKGNPFVSRIVAVSDVEPYQLKQIHEAFPATVPTKPNGGEHPQPDNDLRARWKDLNDRAIRNLDAWVPRLFPKAIRSNQGWRVSSAALGRNLEEDISFTADGIVDFGVADQGDRNQGRRTAIDIVEEWDKRDFNGAVTWLCEALGLNPQEYLPRPKSTGDANADVEVARLAGLTLIQYERERVAAADKLGIRTSTLDKIVTNERAKRAYAQAQPKKEEQERAAKSEAEKLLAELNYDNCVVLDGARTRVLRFEQVEHDAGGEHYLYNVPTFLRFEDFRNLHLNRHIMIGNRSVDVGSWWLQQPLRTQYPGIVFKPGGEHIINGKLNLWRGWGVTPRRGEWDLLREHIYEVLAARDDDVDDYIINWMAWAVQHADEQPEVALVFIGDRGTGRGTLGKVLCKIFGQHARHISSPGHLTGRFNAHQRQCSFLFADEAYAPDDKSAEGQLKRLISEPTLQIEQKGRDPVEEPNRLHTMIASNEEWVIPAGAFERRFVVQQVADTHRQDAEWFGPIYKQLRSGGYEAMLFDLLERDLGNWHPREIVRTAALAEQQEKSLSPFDAWWLELLQTGVLCGADPLSPDKAVSNKYEEQVEEDSGGYGGKRTRTVRHDGLYDQARRVSPKLKGTTDAAFGRYLSNQGCTSARVRRRRGWQFPPLSDCRARWLVRFPTTNWLDAEVKEWSPED